MKLPADCALVSASFDGWRLDYAYRTLREIDGLWDRFRRRPPIVLIHDAGTTHSALAVPETPEEGNREALIFSDAGWDDVHTVLHELGHWVHHTLWPVETARATPVQAEAAALLFEAVSVQQFGLPQRVMPPQQIYADAWERGAWARRMYFKGSSPLEPLVYRMLTDG